jgi:L-threonylcarbamoyladenylate synthase
MLNADLKKEILNCISCLRKGGIIIFPSSTGWNVACDINNKLVSGQLISSNIGDHPAILLSDAGKLQRYLREIPESMFQLIEYSDKPLHLFIDAAINLPAGTDQANTAFTFPNDEFVSSLTAGFGKPLFTISLINSHQPEKSETMFNHPLYVVNLRTGSKNSIDNLVIVRFSTNGSFSIIKK